MGFRGIDRVTGIYHTTVILWVKLVGAQLLDALDPKETPEVGELEKLQTFFWSVEK
ncbi:MAG: hypothetical protein MK289_19290 [Trichodesmium sp. ALOHA_ZT_67]|nr:hypothetical protein [Trichodesmium sp. ALOHA_ZT_67]